MPGASMRPRATSIAPSRCGQLRITFEPSCTCDEGWRFVAWTSGTTLSPTGTRLLFRARSDRASIASMPRACPRVHLEDARVRVRSLCPPGARGLERGAEPGTLSPPGAAGLVAELACRARRRPRVTHGSAHRRRGDRRSGSRGQSGSPATTCITTTCEARRATARPSRRSSACERGVKTLVAEARMQLHYMSVSGTSVRAGGRRGGAGMCAGAFGPARPRDHGLVHATTTLARVRGSRGLRGVRTGVAQSLY